MKIFILGDEEYRHHAITERYEGCQFVRAYNVTDAIAKLEEGPYDIACLDHSLGDWYIDNEKDEIRERTGLDVVNHLIEKVEPTKWPRQVVVHSWNGTCGRLMAKLLEAAGVAATYQPFAA